ncbi:hypothetical protein PQX77_000937 [Marasmius sp. AFHP31]|nr:hypothetical protein PQX77_000937 [Marasmius sp. AFHP31]
MNRAIWTQTFRSDYVLNDIEVVQIQDAMRSDGERCQLLDDEIEGFRKGLAQLEARKRSMDDGIARCQSVLLAQTLRKLPVEIRELVFVHLCEALHEYAFDFGCDPTAETELQHKPTLRVPAITLSHVCSRWNAVVKRCPRLWSSFRVEIYELTLCDLDIELPLSMYFENSKKFPLRICLSEPRSAAENYAHTKYSQIVWKMLTRNLPRCKELVMDLQSLDFPHTFPSDLTFPCLESYHEEQYLCGDLEGLFPSLSYALQRHAPQLTTAVLWDLHSAMPYLQLTSLSTYVLCENEIDPFMSILRTCQRLDSLAIVGLDIYLLGNDQEMIGAHGI